MQVTTASSMAGEPLPQEFEDLFAENYVLVYRTAYGVTGRVEDAEDVVQTVFLRLLQSEKPRDFLKNPKAYLYRAELRAPVEPSDIPRAATIFTAIEEELGLKLERAQSPREYIVIDHVEHPSAN